MILHDFVACLIGFRGIRNMEIQMMNITLMQAACRTQGQLWPQCLIGKGADGMPHNVLNKAFRLLMSGDCRLHRMLNKRLMMGQEDTKSEEESEHSHGDVKICFLNICVSPI